MVIREEYRIRLFSRYKLHGTHYSLVFLITDYELALKNIRHDFHHMVAQDIDKYEEEGSAFYSTARLWDDGIIDPADTRRVLALGIGSSFNKTWERAVTGIFRM